MGSQIKKSGEAVKRLGRLAPNCADLAPNCLAPNCADLAPNYADSSGNGYTPTNCPSRHKGALGGFRGSNIQKHWEAVKRLDRLAPTLVHVCGFVWE